MKKVNASCDHKSFQKSNKKIKANIIVTVLLFMYFITSESLHELEENDLDALMADLVADLNATEEKLAAEIEGLKAPSLPAPDLAPPQTAPSTHPVTSHASIRSPAHSTSSSVSTPASSNTSPLPPPPSQAAKVSQVRPTRCLSAWQQ